MTVRVRSRGGVGGLRRYRGRHVRRLDRTVKVRRIQTATVLLCGGTTLLLSSMSQASDESAAVPTVNSMVLQAELRPKPLTLPLRAATPPDDSRIWAVKLPGSPGGVSKTANIVPEGLGDGVPLLALEVKVGPRRPDLVLTNATKVADLLRALEVRLRHLDEVRPSADSILWPGMRLAIIEIRRVVETVVEPTPFKTLIQYSKDLDAGETQVTTAGAAGSAARTYRVTYRNGRVVSRVLLSELILAEPVDQVLLKGPADPDHGSQIGQASWYDFCHVDGNYAAHLTLPFGTVVTVTNLDNGESVTVVINDRGPFGVPGRIIDLCDSAFAQIAPLSQGVANVKISW